jgi:hypothetical protein
VVRFGVVGVPGKLTVVDTKIDALAERREWVEPEVSELPVEDTAAHVGLGGDGSPIPDCTLS